MKKSTQYPVLGLLVSSLWLSSPALAQTFVPMPPPPQRNVIHLEHTVSLDAAQDVLRLVMGTTVQGRQPQQVQADLNAALNSALQIAKANAQAGAMEVSTGQFSLQPRYGKDNALSGWQGSVELVLQGTDFERLTRVASTIRTLNLNDVSFALSRAQRETVEREAQTQAINGFRAKALQTAQAFGFQNYGLVSVNVSSGSMPMPRRMVKAMMLESSVASSPITVEAGNSTVNVTVNGSIQAE